MYEKSTVPETTLVSRLHAPSPFSAESIRWERQLISPDFTREDKRDGTSCGDTMRPKGGLPQRRRQQ